MIYWRYSLEKSFLPNYPASENSGKDFPNKTPIRLFLFAELDDAVLDKLKCILDYLGVELSACIALELLFDDIRTEMRSVASVAVHRIK